MIVSPKSDQRYTRYVLKTGYVAIPHKLHLTGVFPIKTPPALFFTIATPSSRQNHDKKPK